MRFSVMKDGKSMARSPPRLLPRFSQTLLINHHTGSFGILLDTELWAVPPGEGLPVCRGGGVRGHLPDQPVVPHHAW